MGEILLASSGVELEAEFSKLLHSLKVYFCSFKFCVPTCNLKLNRKTECTKYSRRLNHI